MTDKNYSGFGSRIVLETLKPSSNSDEEDIFLSESIADRPELRVQLRYFTVELKPSRCTLQKNCKRRESKNIGNKNCSTNGQKKVELVKRISSTEATSCESFYSCRSTTSIQELQSKVNNSSTSNKGFVQPESCKSKVIRDDDLLNHLTMVNAIFLSKSVSDSTKQKEIEKERETNISNTCKNESLNISRSTAHKVCSQTYACQVNHNPRIKYISTISGNNIITKPIPDKIDVLRGKMGGDRLSFTKTFSESFEPVLNTSSSFEMFDNIDRYKQSNSDIGLIKVTPDLFTYPKRVYSNSVSCTLKRLELRLPELKFAEIVPVCDESCLPVIFSKSNSESKSPNDIKRRKVVPGCEEKVLGKVSSFISSERKVSALDTADIFNGNGDFSGTDDKANSEKQLNKQFFGNLDESYLNMLISKSLKKLKNESATNLRQYTNYESDESDIFESDEERDEFQTDTSNTFQHMYTNFRNVSLKHEQVGLKPSTGFRDQINDDENSADEESQSSPVIEEFDTDVDCDDEDPELNSSEDSTTNQAGNGFCKRGPCERTRTLAVIQEESSEENVEDADDAQEDNLADDYCLIDSNGRPIHLFDCQGLPLTDNSGRPLRSAQGTLLMNCDQNGIPVVDSDCGIFDMFGRPPHEDRFDPSMAPKMAVCSKLSAGDGRPLLLFDALGRPLTSVSGTMLVDSSGRGLVRLSTSDEHES